MKRGFRLVAALAAVVGLYSLAFGQDTSRVTSIEPATGKVGDNLTITGEKLGKDAVVAVFLSDANADYKAAIEEQSADKIVMKVPTVKAGDYNVSIQVKNNIFIQPVRFAVQQ